MGGGSNRLHVSMGFVPENKLIRIQSVESPLRIAKINQLPAWGIIILQVKRYRNIVITIGITLKIWRMFYVSSRDAKAGFYFTNQI